MKREELRALAEGGVLLVPRAVAAGWPGRTLTRRLKADGWTRIRAGAWAEPGRGIGLDERLRAVQLQHPHLVVSHDSAARLWRIETLGKAAPPPPVEFTDGELNSCSRLTGLRVHRVPLPPDEVTAHAGLRVTEVPRTLADLLHHGPRDSAVVAVDSALTYRRVNGIRRPPLTTPAAIALAMEAPRRGARRAREWLRLVDRGSGSPAETMARLRMHDAGLRPETQAEVHPPGGGRRYVDFLFRAARLAVEIEGYAFHGTRDAHRRDVSRFNELIRCTEIRRILRYTAEDVFHRPARMITEIHEVLADTERSPREGAL